jgi:hypothetical protein
MAARPRQWVGKREHYGLGLRGHVADCARALPAQPLDDPLPPRVTVKVVRSALRIPLALGEKAGVRETVMAAATYILRGGADAMAVSRCQLHPCLSTSLRAEAIPQACAFKKPGTSPVSISPGPEPCHEGAHPPSGGGCAATAWCRSGASAVSVCSSRGRPLCAFDCIAAYPRKMVDIRVGVLVPLLPGCRDRELQLAGCVNDTKLWGGRYRAQ